MNKRFAVGDLVHIPSAVRLLRFDPGVSGQVTTATRMTEQPVLGVVAKYSGDTHSEVFCLGENWVILDSSIFKIENGS